MKKKTSIVNNIKQHVEKHTPNIKSVSITIEIKAHFLSVYSCYGSWSSFITVEKTRYPEIKERLIKLTDLIHLIKHTKLQQAKESLNK